MYINNLLIHRYKQLLFQELCSSVSGSLIFWKILCKLVIDEREFSRNGAYLLTSTGIKVFVIYSIKYIYASDAVTYYYYVIMLYHIFFTVCHQTRKERAITSVVVHHCVHLSGSFTSIYFILHVKDKSEQAQLSPKLTPNTRMHAFYFLYVTIYI